MRLLVLLVAAILATSCGVDPPSPNAADADPTTTSSMDPADLALLGCGAAPFDEPPHAPPIGNRFGWPMPVPLLNGGARLVGVLPATIADGRPVRDVPVPPGPFAIRQNVLLLDQSTNIVLDVLVAFSQTGIGPETSIIDLFANGGGAIVKQSPSTDNDAGQVAAIAGERASLVKVGEYDAALINADPPAPDLNLWNIYWSDGVIDYSIESTGSSEDVVVAARGMMCPRG